MKKEDSADPEKRPDEVQARFRILAELSSDWYWEQDEQHRYIVAGVEPGYGPNPLSANVLGKTRWDNPSANLSAEQWAAHRATLDAHQPFRDFEYSREGLDGVRRWVSASGAPIFHPDGRFKGYVGIGRDISERKRAEQMRELEHSVSRDLAQAHDAPTALEAVMRTVCASESWEWGRYWRFEEAADLVRGAEYWAPPDAPVRTHLHASRNVSMGRSVGLSGHVLQSGKPLWVADAWNDPRVTQTALIRQFGIHGVFLFPVTSEGRILGVLSFASAQVREPDKRLLDAVSVIGNQVGQFLRRMQAEEELRRFRVALDHSADMILLIDRAAMRYVDVNETACRLLGYTRAELTSLGPQDVLPVNRETLERSYDALISNPSSAGSLRSHYLCKDGTKLPFESSRHVLRAGDRYLIAAISRDIRERLSAEAEAREASERIARLNEELETRVRARTAELEALVHELESFTYTISHDLRAPLRAMGGFAEILLADHAEGLQPEARRMLGRVRANARRMSDLVDGLLAFARLGRDSIATGVAPMLELAEQCWVELAPDRKGRTIELRIGNLPPCDGDPVLLKQVWMNLLSNAVKYTRDRTPARIEVDWDPVAAQYFVRDNGTGFDMRYADKLFGVFSRLHAEDEFEGTGLGLAICERIVRRHGGSIRGEGTPGLGASFYFSV